VKTKGGRANSAHIAASRLKPLQLAAISCKKLQVAAGRRSGNVTEGNEGNEVQAGAICCNWLQNQG
jgi:hypothetical protein